MTTATKQAEVLGSTDRTKMLRLSLWDDGRAALSFDVCGRNGEFISNGLHTDTDEMRAFIKDAAEILGLFVSEQPATLKGSAT